MIILLFLLLYTFFNVGARLKSNVLWELRDQQLVPIELSFSFLKLTAETIVK